MTGFASNRTSGDFGDGRGWVYWIEFCAGLAGGGRCPGLRAGGEPDKLTYAGNPENLASVAESPAYRFVQGDICDGELVERLLQDYRPRAVVHFAAESHVDRSIVGPEAFLKTNIDGTFTLLRAAKAYYDTLTGKSGSGSAFCMSRPMRCMGR